MILDYMQLTNSIYPLSKYYLTGKECIYIPGTLPINENDYAAIAEFHYDDDVYHNINPPTHNTWPVMSEPAYCTPEYWIDADNPPSRVVA